MLPVVGDLCVVVVVVAVNGARGCVPRYVTRSTRRAEADMARLPSPRVDILHNNPFPFTTSSTRQPKISMGMENPHEERQAVLLERIIKNVVSSPPRRPSLNARDASRPSADGWATVTGQVQRSDHRNEPLSQGGSQLLAILIAGCPG